MATLLTVIGRVPWGALFPWKPRDLSFNKIISFVIYSVEILSDGKNKNVIKQPQPPCLCEQQKLMNSSLLRGCVGKKNTFPEIYIIFTLEIKHIDIIH